MGTRSQIGYIGTNAIIKSIYCHYDGYVAGVGETLMLSYSDDSAMRGLISLGSIKSLRNDFDEMTDEVLSNNALNDINTSKDVVEFLDYARYNGTEYAYLWTGEYFDAWQYNYRASEWEPIDIYAVKDEAW